MKRTVYLAVVLCLLFVFMGCASTKQDKGPIYSTNQGIVLNVTNIPKGTMRIFVEKGLANPEGKAKLFFCGQIGFNGNYCPKSQKYVDYFVTSGKEYVYRVSFLDRKFNKRLVFLRTCIATGGYGDLKIIKRSKIKYDANNNSFIFLSNIVFSDNKMPNGHTKKNRPCLIAYTYDNPYGYEYSLPKNYLNTVFNVESVFGMRENSQWYGVTADELKKISVCYSVGDYQRTNYWQNWCSSEKIIYKK